MKYKTVSYGESRSAVADVSGGLSLPSPAAAWGWVLSRAVPYYRVRPTHAQPVGLELRLRPPFQYRASALTIQCLVEQPPTPSGMHVALPQTDTDPIKHGPESPPT